MRKLQILIPLLLVIDGILLIITSISEAKLRKEKNELEKEYQQTVDDYEYLQVKYMDAMEIQTQLSTDYNVVLDKLNKLSDTDMEYELSLIEGYNEEEYMIKYNSILDRYNQPNPLYETYTQEEINYMGRCIETEVYGCDFNARCNIASVIINRVNDPRFPNNPISVVTSPNQFAYHRTTISEKTLLAMEYVLLFGDTAQGAIAFQSAGYSDTFNGWSYVFQDNAVHYFYK